MLQFDIRAMSECFREYHGPTWVAGDVKKTHLEIGMLYNMLVPRLGQDVLLRLLDLSY
jgi:hypothetical protein